ncbi:NAD-dependent epimerase/dehydratase family protein [bacterium]|nr:NAD-dependent epimerase/dehydratase family protein [candidate division CSSED10-310 bacterium]
MKNILVTGGAGFVGSHLVEELVRLGHRVTVFDNLDPQVHGENADFPDYLPDSAECIKGDVRDRDALRRAMLGKEVIFHEGAAVGVGQSMYEIRRYTDYNSVGGATLLDILVNDFDVRDKIEKVVVASSMSIYGEGAFECPDCGPVDVRLRPASQLERFEWEVQCPECGKPARALPTGERKRLDPTSVYAITKRDHEEMFLSVGTSYRIPTTALRYFNIYGPRQALSNPYTGVAAIFSSRVLNGNPPVVYEDGAQSRDFVHVTDIVQANILSMQKREADYQVFNVGSGRSVTIRRVGELLIERLAPGSGLAPVLTNKFREGDVRHCFADIGKISATLGYRPRVQFEQGIEDLTEWVRTQTAVDRFEEAAKELRRRGLAQ